MTRPRLRRFYPQLFYSVAAIALSSIALAANFWTSNPTFTPFGIDSDLIGAVFAVIGVGLLTFLRFGHVRLIRIGLATSVAWMLFWGASNTLQSFAELASFQLPLLYLTLAVLQIPLLLAPTIEEPR